MSQAVGRVCTHEFKLIIDNTSLSSDLATHQRWESDSRSAGYQYRCSFDGQAQTNLRSSVYSNCPNIANHSRLWGSCRCNECKIFAHDGPKNRR